MDKKRIIERLLKAQTNGQWNLSAAFGGAGSTSGRPQLMPSDTNKAIEAWLKDDNDAGIRQLADTLYLTGALTDAEHEQIMKAIDGED